MVKSVLTLQKEGWTRVIARRGCTATIVGTTQTVDGVLRPRREDPVVYAPEGESNTASPNRYVFTSITAPLPETGKVTFSSFPGKAFDVVDVDTVTEEDGQVFYRATVKIEDDI